MSLSKLVISGRVIRSPEKRFTPNTNVAVTEFAISVDGPPRQDGSVESHPIKVIAWRDLAERLSQELQKGDLVAVDGRLQFNTYTNAEGQRRRDVEVEAISVENLSQVLAGNNSESHSTPRNNSSRSLAKAAAKSSKNSEESIQAEDLDAIFASEDEIPF